VILRRAAAGDVEALLEVKGALYIRPEAEGGEAPGGGFLLGASREQYAFLVEHAGVWVLQDPSGTVGGFAVALPDPVLRATDLWARRGAIRWEGEGTGELETERVAYFDQLAVRPGRRWRGYAPALAAAVVARLVETEHRHLFATVVREPVRNRASLPLLRAVGARRVGEVEEEYPGVGRVLSEVYHAPLGPDTVGTLLTATPAGRRVGRTLGRLAPGG
jgi:GNAT superfamily N-acetyltransferase